MLKIVHCPRCRSKNHFDGDELAGTASCHSCGRDLANSEQAISERPLELPPRAKAYHSPLDSGAYLTADARVAGQGVAVALVVLLGLEMLLNLMGLVAEWNRLSVVQMLRPRILRGDLAPKDNRLLEEADLYAQAIGISYGVVVIVGLILLLVWSYTAYSNLERLGCDRPPHSRGWAVWGYIVPIANLFVPYQIMQEMYRGSDPEHLHPHPWQNPGSTRIGVWWMLHIVNAIAAQISSKMLFGAKDVDTFVTAISLDMVAQVLDTLTCLLLIFIVRDMMNRQVHKAQRLG